MTPISVCMIARNEEKYLDRCLKLLSAHPFEIILADTGSTDQTSAIARRYTDKVFHFDWTHDFSAARNFTIAQAAHDWILVIDCDEFLETIDIPAIRRAMTEHPHGVGMLIRNNPYSQGNDEAVNHAHNSRPRIATERVARLFSRREHHYEGTIHEQVVRTDGGEISYFPIPLSCYHEGYVNPQIAAAKAERNLKLLLAAYRQQGPDPYLCYQIGKSYTALKEPEKAYRYYSEGLSFDVNAKLEYVQSMVESYGYCLLELKRCKEALQFENIYEDFARRADFPFLMGLIYMNNAMFTEAIDEFKKAVTYSSYSVEGVNGYSAYYNIGVIHECTGNLAQAKEYYLKCGSYPPALDRLRAISRGESKH